PHRSVTTPSPCYCNPLRLSLVVDAAIAADPTVTQDPDAPDASPTPAPVMPPDWRGIDVTLLLEDGDGRLHKVEGTTAGLMTGAGQRIEIPLTADLDGQRVSYTGP